MFSHVIAHRALVDICSKLQATRNKKHSWLLHTSQCMQDAIILVLLIKLSSNHALHQFINISNLDV